MNPLLSLLGSSENTWQYSKNYLFYIAIGAPFILFSNSFGHAVRGAIYIIFSRPVVTLFINDTQTISDYLAIVISLLLLRRSLRKFKGDPS